jgi:hypothetical protein
MLACPDIESDDYTRKYSLAPNNNDKRMMDDRIDTNVQILKSQ